MEAKTKSAHQTKKIASSFAKKLKAGDVVCLYGDLGAGKTVFTQGIAEALGIKKRITSPTFVFVKSYPFTKGGSDLILNHVDLYRGGESKDFSSLGLEELFSNDSVTILEWAQRVESLLPKSRWDVHIEATDETTREITIKRN